MRVANEVTQTQKMRERSKQLSCEGIR